MSAASPTFPVGTASGGPLDGILPRLDGVRRVGDGYMARCPAHEDGHASLSLKELPDGTVLLKCHAGCATDAVVAALGLTMADLYPAHEAGGRSIPLPTRATAQPSHPMAPASSAGSCTRSAYAQAKGLDENFLANLGVSEFSLDGRRALRIPYRDDQGNELAIRFRVALEGDDRFRWRKGSKPALYGQWRLDEACRQKAVVIVEGESDCHTLWQAGFPAVGIPGASTWREEWAEALTGIETIYVVVEPDQGGAAVAGWLSRSSLRERAHLVQLGEAKDPSGLYLADRDGFAANWAAALEGATPWQAYEARASKAEAEALWKQCKELAALPNILERFGETLQALGYAGDLRAPTLTYLALTTRFLRRPVSLVLKGPSSGGKSWTVEQTLRFFPAEAYYALTAMSARALVYSEESLAHRFLIRYEAVASGDETGQMLERSLLSEGHIHYLTVDKTPQGLKARFIDREGPTGLIVTTTFTHLHPENETRMLSVTVSDTPEQTRLVLLALADEEQREVSLDAWVALQAWLGTTEGQVTIPYAPRLAALMPPVSVRLRRDFTAVLNLIRGHAILHQATHERDDRGWIVATIEDYAAVRGLVADLVADAAERSVSPQTRETVEAVRTLLASGEEHVTYQQLARELRLDKSSAQRRARAAVERGYLRNQQERRNQPAQLVLGDPLPEDTPILPEPDQLREGGCTVASDVPEGEGPPWEDEELTPDELAIIAAL